MAKKKKTNSKFCCLAMVVNKVGSRSISLFLPRRRNQHLGRKKSTNSSSVTTCADHFQRVATERRDFVVETRNSPGSLRHFLTCGLVTSWIVLDVELDDTSNTVVGSSVLVPCLMEGDGVSGSVVGTSGSDEINSTITAPSSKDKPMSEVMEGRGY